MEILSVNIGKPQPIDTKSGLTGIFKIPQAGSVKVEKLGLCGDTIIDLVNHGGEDQAVYLYGQPDYVWWSEQLGRELPAGIFGENLTVSEMESASLTIGDRFLIGDVVLEATSPRIPCVTFSERMNDPKFAKKFLAEKRTGIYCRVLTGGEISTGMKIDYKPYEGIQIAANEILMDYKNPSVETMRRYLKAPIHKIGRADYEAKLAAI